MDLFDVAAVEKAESQIDQFISKRARENDEANAIEAAWAESERRVVEKRRRENRESWAAYHGSMHKTHLGIAAEHADCRSRFMTEAGYEPDEHRGQDEALAEEGEGVVANEVMPGD